MAKSLKERLIEQAGKLEKTRRLKGSLATMEKQIKATAEVAAAARAIKAGQGPK